MPGLPGWVSFVLKDYFSTRKVGLFGEKMLSGGEKIASDDEKMLSAAKRCLRTKKR